MTHFFDSNWLSVCRDVPTDINSQAFQTCVNANATIHAGHIQAISSLVAGAVVLISADIGPRENAGIQCVAALISVETHR